MSNTISFLSESLNVAGNKTALILLLIFYFLPAGAQKSFSADPDSAGFVTTDIDNFWIAYDQFHQDTSKNPFGAGYIDIGSQGVLGFLKYRIVDKEHLKSVVIDKKDAYDGIRQNSLRMMEKEKQCRSIFYAMKYWYPRAVFPPVYFVIGAFNSGGTASDDGLIIGIEMQKNVDNIPYMIAHELIHFQQHKTNNPTLLTQSIHEGAADFLGELIGGYNTNKTAVEYGRKHRDKLCAEFASRMNGVDFTDWLYGLSGKDDRPSDLGYWMGYEIVKAYFDKEKDKRRAIEKIINMENYLSLLKESGYLKSYLP